MITFTPEPIAIHLGPIPVYWYGIAYAVGLLVSYMVLVRQARRFGQDVELIGNGLIVIAIAALIGGRLYHVIDQWNLYKDNLLKIVLPPYSGLGVYGGLITGALAFLLLVRWHRINGWIWADIVAPALFTMQAIGRWGNFFNQELYGPPTKLPWGIAIDCAHRFSDHGTVIFPCTQYPEATTFFQPLFLYESISGLLGALFLIWLSRRRPYRLRAGDQILIFFIWYAIVRFLLENLRTGNWFVGGVPTAQLMSILFGLGAFLMLLYRHRRPFEPVAEAALAAGDRGDAPAGDLDDDWDDEADDDEADDDEADDDEAEVHDSDDGDDPPADDTPADEAAPRGDEAGPEVGPPPQLH
jgi:phosphatidylglycerol:prolipoprotein diacylglycerol transferase